ncbi:AMP-binding protein [Halocatena salina]|uniref:AMP-dependent synthetase/ligase domain-containing protein n=1 Tax=Halocatena salina TaxID=2934340 RepID=A0A8U0A598_9EURY|nr:AMP-binding protein [Halocatena salina]UPM44026.1 hypothetical protein MW046_06175 [Halocatena salina]
MTGLEELLTRDRRTDSTALRDEANDHQYDYRRFCTTVWKVGNLLHHFGVRSGTPVVIAGDRQPEPVLSVLATAMLGGVVRFGSEATTEAKVIVAPTPDLEPNCPPGTHRIGYGERPDDPGDTFFEQDVWRENPTEPPATVDPDAPVLQAGETIYTHRALLNSAQSVVDRQKLTADSTVAVRAPLERPETIVAGIIAPLVAGATILLPDDGVDDCLIVVENGSDSQRRVIDAVEL